MTTTIMPVVLLFVVLTHGAQSLSCSCRMAQCKDSNLLKQQCKGGLVYDVCHCCLTCAKVEGEVCGGFWGFEGTCDQGLFCKHSGMGWGLRNTGICTTKQTKTSVESTEAKSGEDPNSGSGDEETEPTEDKEYSTEDDEFPTTQILTTTESSYSGDQSRDEEIEPTTNKWIWLPTLKSDPTTEKQEIPTSSEDENEFPTTVEKILTATEASYSGDQSGDDELTERRTSTTWAWLPTLRSEPTGETTKKTETPTRSEDDEDENIVIF